MHQTKRLPWLIPGFLLAVTLSGCSVFPKCAPENCAVDAQIKQDVDALFAAHTELGPPGTIRVQSINKVVYLHGLVNSDFERQNAEALARGIPNVKDVVNSIAPRGSGAR
jgi:osmotically-inducible protein OsmY